MSVWPEGHDCEDAATWCLMVTCRGRGQWAVERGWSEGRGKPVLGADGRWHPDAPSHPGLRFSRDDALALAFRHAATVTVGGITSAEAQRLHDQQGCPGG